MIIAPDPSVTIVKEDKTMEERFRLFTLAVSNLGIEVGTGSPEGVVTALSSTLYMDDVGTTGNVLYIKRDDDIGGDKTLGWILT